MSNPETFLTRTRNGIDVFYDAVSSHTATHFKDSPELINLAKEVIEQTDAAGEFMMFHVDFKRIVGSSDLVTNMPGDVIVYAKRLNRNEYSVFNKSRPPETSSLVTVALEKHDDRYALVSAWIGRSDAPSFPDTVRETSDSRAFWKAHSLSYGRQEIQPGTETDRSPW